MLCLAVVHHLALTGTVPLDEVVAMLADFAAPVVVEFPHRDDPMAARLLARKRTGLFDAYDLPPWEARSTGGSGCVRRAERCPAAHARCTTAPGPRERLRRSHGTVGHVVATGAGSPVAVAG